VLVLGSFIFFAGKNFTIPFANPSELPTNVKTITGVVPWMVVVILARELLVTSIRSLFESGGHAFGAMFSGKLKMVFQSVTILIILVYVNYHVGVRKHYPSLDEPFLRFRQLAVWGTVIVTIWSGFLYVQKAMEIYRSRNQPPAVT
jgi:phosphatidylglycerophosphate synthase